MYVQKSGHTHGLAPKIMLHNDPVDNGAPWQQEGGGGLYRYVWTTARLAYTN